MFLRFQFFFCSKYKRWAKKRKSIRAFWWTGEKQQDRGEKIGKRKPRKLSNNFENIWCVYMCLFGVVFLDAYQVSPFYRFNSSSSIVCCVFLLCCTWCFWSHFCLLNWQRVCRWPESLLNFSKWLHLIKLTVRSTTEQLSPCTSTIFNFSQLGVFFQRFCVSQVFRLHVFVHINYR